MLVTDSLACPTFEALLDAVAQKYRAKKFKFLYLTYQTQNTAVLSMYSNSSLLVTDSLACPTFDAHLDAVAQKYLAKKFQIFIFNVSSCKFVSLKKF